MRLTPLLLLPLLCGVLCGLRAPAGEAQLLKLAAAQRVAPEQVTATGRVIPLLAARLGSRVTGVMKDLGRTADGQWVDIGVHVKAGQELFSVDPATFDLVVKAGEASLKFAQATLADLRAGARPEQREVLKAEIDEIDAQLEQFRRDEARFQELVKIEGAASQKQLEQVQFSIKEALARKAAAVARHREAENGPTPTAVAMAEARVAQAQVTLNIALRDREDASIKAPYDGVVTRRFKGPGDYLTHMPFTEVMEFVSLQHLVAELRMPEAYFHRVVPGKTRVLLRSPLLKEAQVLPVARVIPSVDPMQGSFGVWLALPPGTPAQLAPGAFLQGDVQLAESGDAVIVPKQAVVSEGGGHYAFVVADGRMQRRKVEVGDSLTDAIIVKSGLGAGQRVVLGPVDQLKDGAPLPPELLKPQ